jgi:hypothetical protein
VNTSPNANPYLVIGNQANFMTSASYLMLITASKMDAETTLAILNTAGNPQKGYQQQTEKIATRFAFCILGIHCF